MRVTALEARPLRSLAGVRVELGVGLLSLVGPNGSGKTNLLEALYFALTGRYFRTSDRRELIPFGDGLARAEAIVHERLVEHVERVERRPVGTPVPEPDIVDGGVAGDGQQPRRRRAAAGCSG